MRSLCLLTHLQLATATAMGQTGTLIVLNKSDHTASLVDAATRKTVATVPTGL